MDLPQSDFERIFFFEHARKTAETSYAQNPLDADNLTRWGGALLELSQFQSGPDCVKMIEEGIAKLEEALNINPTKHDTLWCLGNAHTSHGFLINDHGLAKSYFAKASECFKKAIAEEPGNEIYIKSLEMAAKAPELHLELQRQVVNQQVAAAAGGSSSSGTKQKILWPIGILVSLTSRSKSRFSSLKLRYELQIIQSFVLIKLMFNQVFNLIHS